MHVTFFEDTSAVAVSTLWASLAVLCLLTPTIAGSAHGASLLWYGGDAVSGFSNNTRVTATFGDSILDDFIVSDVIDWHVTSLFSNNLAEYPIDSAPFTQAVWSIRTGVSAGLAKGTGEAEARVHASTLRLQHRGRP
jgi:hypothetical protein